ncbi:phosphatidylinositol kinase- protein kinase tor1, partial [Xylographa carneopallida]|nr:phosphatidylinositol kinase- protein kinase tor1 [Xylographa carneopallida]
MSDEIISRYLSDLRSRNDEVRMQASADLRLYIARLSRELPTDSFQSLNSDLNRHIFTLVNSTDPYDKLASITLITHLTPITATDDNETKLIRYANYLRMVFQHSGLSDIDQRLLREAAHALGQLAAVGGVMAADMVEFEVKRALEWLEGDRSEQRRYCAVCVLKELCEHTPTLFAVHVGVMLDRLWVVLRDVKLMLREAANEAMRACLRLIAKRSWKLRQTRYTLIWQEVLASVRAGSSESIHAGLLTIGELLSNTGEFMSQRYRETCEIVMRYREHKEKYVRETVIALIPKLAAYSPATFHSFYFRDALAYLLTSLKLASSSRECLFLALGSLSLHMRDAIVPDLDIVLQLCKEGLTARSKKAFCAEALTCVGRVCEAVGRHPRLVSQMGEVIEQMFSAGLSRTLVDALTVVSRALPSYLPSIQERLLTGLTVILTSTSLTQNKSSGSSSSSSSGPSSALRSLTLPFSFPSSFNFPLFSPSPELKPQDPAASELLLLALHTLGSFEFSRWDELLVFVRDVVVGYLEDERPRVRRQAALTCAEVVLKGSRSKAGGGAGAVSGVVAAEELSKMEERKERAMDEEKRRDDSDGREHSDSGKGRVVQRLVAGIESRQSSPSLTTIGNGTMHRTASNPSLVTAPARSATPPNLPPSPSQPPKLLLRMPTPPNLGPAIPINISPNTLPANTPHANQSPPALLNDTYLSASAILYPALITDILDRLLTVSISDPDPTIRHTILSSFHGDAHFDLFLSSPGNVHSLFVIANDELFSIRETVLSLVGRLASSYPSTVMPSLRKTLIQLLTELQYTADQRQREESALLIGHLLLSSGAVMRPYVGSILKILIVRLSDSSQPSVITCVLQTLEQLAAIGGPLLRPSLPTLLPLIVPLIEDKSSLVSKQVALRCLTALVEYTGHVIEVYVEYRRLLGVLLALLRVGVAWNVRREVMRLIAVLGALDPYRYKELTADAPATPNDNNASGEKLNTTATTIAIPPPQLPAAHNTTAATTSSMRNVNSLTALPHPHDDYYPTIAINALMSILSSSTLAAHHTKVIQALSYVARNMSASKLVTFLPHLVPPAVAILSATSPSFGGGGAAAAAAVSGGGGEASSSVADDMAVRESLLGQLIHIANIAKQHIRPYIPQLLSLSLLFLSHYTLLDHVFLLINRLSIVMRDEWRAFLSQLLPSLLSLLSTDRSPQRQLTMKTLHTFDVFGASLAPYLHLIIPALLRLCEAPDLPGTVRLACVRSIGLMARSMDVREYAGRIVHPLARLLDSGGGGSSSGSGSVPATPKAGVTSLGGGGVVSYGGVRDEVLVVLCLLVYQLQADYLIFIPMMHKILQRHAIHHERYDALIHRLLSQHPLTPHDIAQLKLSPAKDAQELVLSDDADALLIDTPPTPSTANSAAALASAPSLPALSLERTNSTGMKKLSVSQPQLKKAWEVSQRSTADDWQEWFRVLSIELLKESPSPPLRACSVLAQKYHLLARELFAPAFASCWGELSDEYEDDLVRCLEIAFNSPSIPPELITVLLNLAEYMERDGQRLPIDVAKLGVMAEGVHAYAKALHYKEMEWQLSPQQAMEGLIGIHNQLGQPDSAVGVLEWGKRELAVEVRESWYEKLGHWREALEAYEVRGLEVEGTGATEAAVGRMRCLRQLCEWERLDVLAGDVFRWSEEESVRREIAPLAAQAAWMRGKWADMARYLACMEEGRIETDFLHAVLAVEKDDWPAASLYIERTRESLDSELSALVSESYPRAYRVLVQVQQLGELEEVVEWKRCGDGERRGLIREMWSKRLHGCSEDVDVWQALLSVRSMVMQPSDGVDTYLHFSKLCRKSNRMAASLRVFTQLLHTDTATLALPTLPSQLTMQQPTVVYAYLKHLWAAGMKKPAYTKLQHFVNVLSLVKPHTSSSSASSGLTTASFAALRAKSYLKLGSWQLLLDQDQLSESNIPPVLSAYQQATLHSSTYKVWHHYATFTFRILSHTATTATSSSSSSSSSSLSHPISPPAASIVVSVRAFFKSISLAGDQALQD